jgi:DNA-binding CsgD family transcriptional regulator
MRSHSPGRKPGFTAKQVQRMREMKAEGLSNRDIAQVMNTSANTVSMYLLGKTRPVDDSTLRLRA